MHKENVLTKPHLSPLCLVWTIDLLQKAIFVKCTISQHFPKTIQIKNCGVFIEAAQ